jgi:para-nitrobenzyl esterase
MIFAPTLVALALTYASVVFAQEEPGGGHTPKLTLETLPAKASLTVTSPSFNAGGDIPFENTQYRGNHFPGVAWTKGPAETKSYVVVMQGELGKATSIHLTLFNVGKDVTSLPVDMKAAPAGALFGASLHGINQGYVGPHTHNFEKQRYHLQVFALDTRLPDGVRNSFSATLAAMGGHVIASGEIVGLATMDPNSKEAEEYRAKLAAGNGKAVPKE